MPATKEPTLRKRGKREPIGYMQTLYRCLDCWDAIDPDVLPWAEECSEELREGDDAGVPYTCFKCGQELTPRGGG